MAQEDEQIDSLPIYDVKIDRSQGVVIGDNARVEQHFHGVPPAPAVDLAAAEVQYRQQVVDRYNWLGFGGFEQADLMLTDVPLTKVFVRLSLTVEKVVREAEEAQGPEDEEQTEERRERAGAGQPKRAGGARAQDEVTKRTAPGREEQDKQRAQERIIKVQEPVALVEALQKNVLLVGEPGAGKSTLLRWLAVTFAQGQQHAPDRLGPEADADRLPVYVELGRLPETYLRGDGGKTPAWWKLLPELLAEQEAFDSTATAVLTQALADGRCLVLCDGLDEVADRTARSRIAQSLVEFARRPAGNRVVIGSRPAGMAETESSIRPGFERCQIERFAPAEVQQFFRFWYQLDTALTPQAQTASADELYTRLEHMPGTMKLATTPLLATILLLIWRNEGSLPARRVEVYERCCKMLVENWERHHSVQYVGTLANLGWQRHLRLLAPLAYTIHSREERTSASLQELVPVLAQALVKEGLNPEEKSARLEAEKYLATLGLRSGLLQRLGPDEYGFPHLTFQEYLVARHVGDQNYPDYIDLFMAHLHEGWWREVHLLTLGHLGSGEQGGEKVSRLILEVLNRYPPPWRILRPSRHALVRLIEPGRWFPTLQWQRRLAWLSGLALELVASGYREMVPGVVTKRAQTVLNLRASEFVIDSLQDKAWRYVIHELTVVLGQVSPAVVEALICALADHDSDVRHAAATKLGALGPCSSVVVEALTHAFADDNPYVRYAAAFSLRELGQVSPATEVVLLHALADRNWYVREEAASSLGELSQVSPTVMEALIRALADDNTSVRQAVAFSLDKLGQVSPAVVEALIRALANNNVRYMAESILGRLGQVSPTVVERLIHALADNDSGVRRAAASILGKLGQASPTVVEALLRVLANNNSHVRYVTVSILGDMGQASSEVVEALLGALADDNFGIRFVAAVSLGELGQASPEVVEALLRALADNDSSVRWAAAVSLGDLGQASPEVLEALLCALAGDNTDVRRAAAVSLGELGQASPTVVEALLRALADNDSGVRRAAAASLGELGQASPAVVEALLRALADNDSGVRRAAAVSLGELGQASPAVVEALLRALADDDTYVHQAAAVSLGKLRQAAPEVVEALIRALDGFLPFVTEEAANSLVELGQVSPMVVEGLMHAMVHSHVRVQLAAASTLVRLSQVSPVAVERLTRALTDGNTNVRQAAAASLGELGQASPAVLNALVRALADDDLHVRRTAASTLGKLGQTSPAVAKALIRALADYEADVRQTAASSLGQLAQNSPATTEALIRALGDSHWDVRQQAADSLVKLGQASPVAVEALVRALGDSDSWVRQRAADSLVKLGQASPAVVEALVRALADWNVRKAAASSLGKLRGLSEDERKAVALALLRCMHDIDNDVRRIALESAQTLLAGRPIPGPPWQKLQDRIAPRRKRLMIARLLAIGAAVVVVVPALLMLLQEQLGADSRPVSYLMAFVVVIGVFAAAAQILGYVDQKRASDAGSTPDKH